MPTHEAVALAYSWRGLVARDNQLPPDGEWLTCLALAGRGYGKTRAICEWLLERIRHGCRRAAIVGRTAADIRDILIDGESGLLRCAPPWDRPRYYPSRRRVEWRSGAIATCYSAAEPDLLRGPQHDVAIADEVAAWDGWAAWDNLMMGLRLGSRPQVFAATTPRPLRWLRELIADPTTVVLRGSTWDNRENLPDAFFAKVVAKYDGTSLGAQELHGELLDEARGALWRRAWFDDCRVDAAPQLARIVIAIDPAVTAGSDSDETGIIVAGKGRNGRYYVLADLSGRMTPGGWAQRALGALDEWGADRIVAEVNQGGDLVESALRTLRPSFPYRAVRASRGKQARAEPISALYEQQRVSHVRGLTRLEDQLCSWEPGISGDSPDRLDALVWALTELSGGAEAVGAIAQPEQSRWR